MAELFRIALERRLEEKLLSKAELSRRTGIGRSLIDRYLKRSSVPGLEHAHAIARAFGLSIDDFIGTVPSAPAPPPKLDVVGAIEIMGALRAERKAGVDGPISKRLFEQIAEIERDGD